MATENFFSGPAYEDALQKCAQVAKEDFEYSSRALNSAFLSLQEFGTGLTQAIQSIQRKMIREGENKTTTDVVEDLGNIQKELLNKNRYDLDSLQKALQAKQRSLNHFSIAVMGRTKAGKSTLHSVVTGEGRC
jgi:50S ribosomal subunit-associated GTPase HflX